VAADTFTISWDLDKAVRSIPIASLLGDRDVELT